MELMLSCPHCKCALIFFEHYNYYNGINEVLCFADGYCPQCHRKYHLACTYKLNCFENLNEVNKDEDY